MLLAWAVVWAQMAGLMHRVEHGAGVGALALHAEVSTAPSPELSSTTALHSCVLFDGLCLADTLPTALAPPVAPGLALPLPPAFAFVSWHALLVSHFLSRGPPKAA